MKENFKERIIILHFVRYFPSNFKGSEVLLFINHCASCKGNQTKAVLDSGFHDMDSGLQVLDSSPCVGFLLLVGFRIP